MRHVNFDMDLQFDNPRDRWLSEQILLLGMNILAVRNYYFLKENPGTLLCYDDNNCTYLMPEQLEHRPSSRQIEAMRKFLATKMGMTKDEIQHHIDFASGVEIFRDIPRMQEHGGGDCDNWAARRAAEISVAGGRAKPCLTWREQDGRTIYHAKVLWNDGSDEDPSIIKGMGGAARAADRRFECWKNLERYNNYWNEAKQMLASERFSSEEQRVARAAYLKARIDALGLLPKDGVFRVGEARPALIGCRRPAGWMELRAAS